MLMGSSSVRQRTHLKSSETVTLPLRLRFFGLAPVHLSRTRKSFVLRKHPGQAESENAETLRRLVPVPYSRAHIQWFVVPRAAAQHTLHPISRPCAAINRSVLVAVVITVFCPFPHIPQHIIQPECIDLEAGYGSRVSKTIRAIMYCDCAVLSATFAYSQATSGLSPQ
jgi:hypothetical protein